MKQKFLKNVATAGGGAALALALAMTSSPVMAVPYASQIRFGEATLVAGNVNVDLIYTLNEDADRVTVEVYNNSTATVARTYVFNSPDVETTIGRHAITWDGLDNLMNSVTIGGNEYNIRVRVQKLDATTEWTLITSNGSGLKATEKTSIFEGYSPNDIEISVDDSSDQFGILYVAHSYNGAPPGGFVLLGTDLEPILGDGGGNTDIKGQHIAALPGSYGIWKSNFDPINPELIWWGGQTGDQRIGVFNSAASDPNDIQGTSDVVWATTLFPRGIAIHNNAGTRVGYSPMSNEIRRLTLDTLFPYTVQSSEIITAATIGGVTRYAQDVVIDRNGNLYFLSRLGGGLSADSTLWRWNAADVAAAPGVLLDETNAAWHVQFPAGTTHGNALHIDPISGAVLVAANNGSPRGVWIVGNTADATLPAKPYVLSAANQILDFDNATQFPVGYSLSTLGNAVAMDRFGNVYVTTRTAEEIHSFSPPGNGTNYDITTQSRDTLEDDPLFITLLSFDASAPGYGAPVTITWATGTEIDNTGFHLDRVAITGGNPVASGRVNAFLIPAAGVGGGGAEYSFVDAQPLAEGEKRGYVLVDVDANGTQSSHGPVSVKVGTSEMSGEAAWSLY